MGLSLAPVLTQDEIDRIHEHSLDLLERVGIDYKTPRALETLEKYGCPVDYQRTWASLPRELVEWALQQAPRVVTLSARDPARDVKLDGIRPHHTTDSQGTQGIDLETGELHDSTAADLRKGLLFADALRKELNNIDSEQRNTFLLRYQQHFSIKEIAAILAAFQENPEEKA